MNNGNNPPTHLYGEVKPKKFYRSKPPFWEKWCFIAQEGDFFAKMRLYVHEPTLEFPQTGMFLALSNSTGHVFIRISQVICSYLKTSSPSGSRTLNKYYLSWQIRNYSSRSKDSPLTRPSSPTTNSKSSRRRQASRRNHQSPTHVTACH